MLLFLKGVFRERLTLKLIPHSDRSIYSFSLPRMVLFFLLFFFFTLQVTTGVLLVHYTTLFEQETGRSIRFMERLDEVQQENLSLRSSIEHLTLEAERIRDKLQELQEQDQRIRELIDTSDTGIFHLEVPLLKAHFLLPAEEWEGAYGIARLSSGEALDVQTAYGGMGGVNSLLDISSFVLLNRAHKTIDGLKKAIPQQMEQYEVLEEEVRQFSALLASKPAIWPLLDDGDGFITSSFGYRLHPISRIRQFHEGVDIGVWYNTPVVATANGVVEFSGWKGGFGRTVVIDHGYGYKTVYAHNNSLVVNPNDRVERGDTIAYSGNSGYSTGPHLHYEVILHGESQDPEKFFRRR